MAKLKRKLKTTKISGGKEIVPWVERLNYFNDYYRPNGFVLKTDIVEMNDSIIVMQGQVHDSDGRLVADGIAYKKSNEHFAYQKCQSGALNRALFILGIVNSGEDTIMDEDEAKELSRTKLQDASELFANMVAHIPVDFTVVESKIPAYKNQLSSQQISELTKLINVEKAKKAVAKATK